MNMHTSLSIERVMHSLDGNVFDVDFHMLDVQFQKLRRTRISH